MAFAIRSAPTSSGLRYRIFRPVLTPACRMNGSMREVLPAAAPQRVDDLGNHRTQRDLLDGRRIAAVFPEHATQEQSELVRRGGRPRRLAEADRQRAVLEHAAEDLAVADVERENHEASSSGTLSISRTSPSRTAPSRRPSRPRRSPRRSPTRAARAPPRRRWRGRRAPGGTPAPSRGRPEQAAVSRAEGQAVGFADRRAGDNRRRQKERLGHPAHERSCCQSFSPK